MTAARRVRRTARPRIGATPALAPGLTLLEVVLTVTLTVALVGAVYAFYHVTLGLRDGLSRQGQTAFAQRRVLDLMGDELQSAIVYPFLQMGMDGAADQVVFLRAVVPSRAVYQGERLRNGGEGVLPEGVVWEPEHDVQMVTYRLNRYEDDAGVEQIGGLERTCLRTLSAPTAQERGGEEASSDDGTAAGATIQVTFLTDHVKFLRLTYWDGSAWAETWQNSSLPAAVRIDLGEQPLPENLAPDEYPYETVWRVVPIPAGESAAGQESAAQAPGDETPADETAAAETPAGDASAEQSPAPETPAARTGRGQTPTGQAAAERARAGGARQAAVRRPRSPVRRRQAP